MGQAQNIEKQIQLLSTLHIGFMAAGIFFLILAVVLFIYLKIPEVFNEYRGKSAKKEMENGISLMVQNAKNAFLMRLRVYIVEMKGHQQLVVKLLHPVVENKMN